LKERNKAILVANTGFSLYHFRLPLMQHLKERGWELTGIANDESDFKQKFEKLGFRFFDVAIDHKGLNPLNDILFMIRLSKLYKNERPKLVHHFTIKPAIFGSIAAKLAQVPTIVNTITGLGYAFQKSGLLQLTVQELYRISLAGRPRVVFQNRDDRDLFLRKKIVKKSQSHVILGSGVNTLAIRPKGRSQKDTILFLLFSRMLWSKGVEEFVKAAIETKKRFPESRFIMAGGHSGGGAKGNPDAIPREWLRSVNQNGCVKWVGRLSFENMMELLDECDVCVLPSNYREGVPKSLLEAAASGKAIITTDNVGCREVVIDGVNGFLVPVRDVDALAEAMMMFIRRPRLMEKMGRESRKIAEELFDERMVRQQTILVYEEAGAL
jgi:glycosyltransferase involved in cell wall biosynthesis